MTNQEIEELKQRVARNTDRAKQYLKEIRKTQKLARKLESEVKSIDRFLCAAGSN